MIGGGSWKSQNNILNGSYLNFVSKGTKAKPTITTVNPSGDNDIDDSVIYLTDRNGTYLKTADGKLLAVSGV